jgi:hypothetical protein
MKIYQISVILLSLSLYGCVNKKAAVKIDLNSKIKEKCIYLENASSMDSISLNFCTLIPIHWDSIVVLTAYISPEKLDELKFDNTTVTDKFYDRMDDHSVTMLYIEKNSIIGYSTYIGYIDIYNLSHQKYQGHMIFTRDQCDNFFIKKTHKLKYKFKFVSTIQ